MLALVKFQDSGRAVRHLVPVSDIKDFRPANASDFNADKVYMVKWQKSEVVDELYHDGYYPAKILVLGGKKCTEICTKK
jgi:hypothetical protein